MLFTRRQVFAGALGLWVVPSGAAEPLPRNVMLYGRDEPLPAAIPLRAGPVTALFEPGIAFLRYVKYGDGEILRGLYCAVRDKVWGTVAPRVSNVVTESRAGSFLLTFDVDNVEGDIDFGWKGKISGDAQGSVRFEFTGKARSTFQKNRLGFAVLHPLKECAGKRAIVEHASGVKEESAFPDAISPSQPFFDLRSITHEVAPGVMAEVRFEGDIFETEDHRNWTDANFKTYCTPLARPYPVEVPRNAEIRQAVQIRLKGAGAVKTERAAEVFIDAAGTASTKLPSIGSGVASGEQTLSAREAARVKAAGMRHLRAELRLYDNSWKLAWERAVKECAATGAGLEAAVFVSNAADRELAELAQAKGPVARWMIFHKDESSTAEKWVALARNHLNGAPIGAGTQLFFTELNRERPPVNAIDFACYSLNPQVHAFDNTSIVENLEGQAHTVRSGHKFLGGKPIVVAPVTLRQRFNPQAKGAPEPVIEGRLPSRIDPRQMSLLGACWTLGSVKYLAENGVSAITYFETHGWAGLMESEKGNSMPRLFPSIPGTVFPLYHVLADVNELPGADVIPVTSSESLRACALALKSGNRRRMLAANLTPEPQILSIDASLAGAHPKIKFLDEHSFEAAVKSPEEWRKLPGAALDPLAGRLRVALLPYSVAKIE